MIENLYDNVGGVDCKEKGLDLSKALYGNRVNSNICSTPFFRAFVDVDCQLMPCCHIPRPQKFGDIREGFKKVWKGEKYINFLIKMLKERGKMPICNLCMAYRSATTEKEVLDDFADKLIGKYKLLLMNKEEK